MDSHAKVALAVLKWKLLRDHVAFIGAIVTVTVQANGSRLEVMIPTAHNIGRSNTRHC